jgi:hypothetical protein
MASIRAAKASEKKVEEGRDQKQQDGEPSEAVTSEETLRLKFLAYDLQ